MGLQSPRKTEDEFAYTCSECGAEVDRDAEFCPSCGADISEIEVVDGDDDFEYACSECGATVSESDQVCSACGADISEVDDESRQKPASGFVCMQCGADVTLDDRACPACGSDLEAASDEEDEYVCSECGAEVELSDLTCPSCGADISEVDQGNLPDWPGGGPGRVLSGLELAFLGEALALPDGYSGYLSPSRIDRLRIPAREPRIGDLWVRFLNEEILVSVGTHTEVYYRDPREAVDFIRAVLADEIVFYFGPDGVEQFEADELDDADARDWNYYVWSGRLRDKRSGIEWYRPD